VHVGVVVDARLGLLDLLVDHDLLPVEHDLLDVSFGGDGACRA